MSADQRWETVSGGVEHTGDDVVLRLEARTAEGNHLRGIATRIRADRWGKHYARTLDLAVRDLERFGPIR